MNQSKIIINGFLQALGVVVCVALVALIMQNGEKIFGKMPSVLGPITFLLLFVLSAAITGALVLGRPLALYLENRKAEGIKLFLCVLAWLFVIILIALIIQIFL